MAEVTNFLNILADQQRFASIMVFFSGYIFFLYLRKEFGLTLERF